MLCDSFLSFYIPDSITLLLCLQHVFDRCVQRPTPPTHRNWSQSGNKLRHVSRPVTLSDVTPLALGCACSDNSYKRPQEALSSRRPYWWSLKLPRAVKLKKDLQQNRVCRILVRSFETAGKTTWFTCDVIRRKSRGLKRRTRRTHRSETLFRHLSTEDPDVLFFHNSADGHNVPDLFSPVISTSSMDIFGVLRFVPAAQEAKSPVPSSRPGLHTQVWSRGLWSGSPSGAIVAPTTSRWLHGVWWRNGTVTVVHRVEQCGTQWRSNSNVSRHNQNISSIVTIYSLMASQGREWLGFGTL